MNKINFDHINSSEQTDDFFEICRNSSGANPDEFHFLGRIAKAEIEKSRNVFAEKLNCLANDLFFGSNTTLQSIQFISHLILFTGISDVYTSIFESEKLLIYLKTLEKEKKINIHWLKTDFFGKIDLNDFKTKAEKNKKTALLNISHGNEFNGLLIPVKEISKICSANKLLFYLNLKPTICKYKIDIKKLNPDFASFDLTEYGGNKNCGVFYINKSVALSNKHYRNLRNIIINTENRDSFSACKLSYIFKKELKNTDNNFTIINSLKKYFITQLQNKLKIQDILYEYKKEGIYTILSVFFPESQFGKYLAEKLDMNKFAVKKLNYPVNMKEKGSFIRFSLSTKNTNFEIDQLIQLLIKIKSKY